MTDEMTDELVINLHQLIQAMAWPDEPTVSAESQQLYEHASDLLLLYHGDPRLLYEALHLFAETGSRPYAYAGIAQTLLFAAFEKESTADLLGIEAAIQWLRRAQKDVNNRVEINYLDAVCYLMSDKRKSARLVLDYFQKHEMEHVYVCFAEMHYWAQLGQVNELQRWFQRANVLSLNPIHRLYALIHLGGSYFSFGRWDDCIQTYNLATTLYPDDPWVWHNLSLAYINIQNYKDAVRCNQKALSIMQFPAAMKVEAALLKAMGRL